MPLKDETRFVIISFDEYSFPTGEKATGLVPKRWIHETSQGIWFCTYPSEEDYPKIAQWVEEEIAPEEEWISFLVTILAEASK